MSDENQETGVVDGRHYRDVIGGFATGVTIVTSTGEAGTLEGMTANAVTSVSMDPVLLAVCFNHGSSTLDAVISSGSFVVNLLSSEQEGLSNAFARRGPAPFGDCEYRLAESGNPVLSGGLGFLECKTHHSVEAGDHIVVFGEVVRCESKPGDPLLFFRGGYRQVAPLDDNKS